MSIGSRPFFFFDGSAASAGSSVLSAEPKRLAPPDNTASTVASVWSCIYGMSSSLCESVLSGESCSTFISRPVR